MTLPGMVDQTAFRRAILDPTSAVPDGLTDPQGRPAGKRFDVYRNNVVVSLSTALSDAFPVITKLLGDNNFKILAGHFVRQHPPRTPVIAQYGAELPAFLEAFEPVQSLGYLPDIARLELALRRSYHAQDSQPIDPVALQNLPPDRLMAARFELAPSVHVLRSAWPIVSIWRFNMEDGAPQPNMRAEDALITRAEFDPEIALLSPGAGVFVERLQEQASFGSALEAATEAAQNFDLTTALGALITGGAITNIIEEPAP